MAVQLEGQLLASTDLSMYSPTKNWIEFQYIDGLSISGGGRIDGRGASAWPQNECPKKSKCHLLPVSLVLSFVTNATISRISLVDSKSFHVNIFASKNVQLDSITVTAPADSPNTDGIHVGDSVGVSIANSVIGTGDDCVSIGPGSVNISVSNVSCGPGHGISVGSLGKYPDEKDVVGVTVKNCTLTGTTNGVRVKTWQSTPSPSTASDFVFEDITMNNVSNPIIIDQEYCPRADCTQTSPSQVKIDRIVYRNIKGTSASQEAIKLVCSKAVPCNGVELSNINLVYNGDVEQDLTTICVNVKGTSNGNVMPNSCI
ncbi:exopolygalacturonase-like [Typha angustifolia]|uniref:exopolygalacturonase-like n=1 Tax=Typha angustifolia TaxID=59011 RepID=UPI003C2BA0AC